MSRAIHLGRIAGIPIRIDPSWFIVLALVSWTLATGYFPSRLLGVTTGVYWALGVGAAVLLFSCVLLHELGHALTARAFGLPVRQVTLFLFGGVAHMGAEARRPGVEFLVAAAGPAVSVGIVAGCLGVLRSVPPANDARVVALVLLQYVAFVNTALVMFNLLPGFPLDGGRVLRAVLWAWWKDVRKATRVAAACGSALGVALMALGALSVVQGRWINGLWGVFLGLYLRQAARASAQDVQLRGALETALVSSVMRPHHEPVIAGELPPIIVNPSDTLLTALARMQHGRVQEVWVVRDGAVVGTVTHQGITEWLRTQT